MRETRGDGATALLDCLGLSRAEEAVYLRLLAEPGLAAPELARRLDMTQHQLGYHTESLIAYGLVERDGTHPAGWRATAPDIALEALMRRREAELMKLRGRVDELMRSYRRSRQAPGSDELIEVVSGREAIAGCWRTLQDSAHSQIQILDKSPHVLAADPQYESTLIRKGVVVQVIYESQVVRNPERLADIHRYMSVGEHSRMLPRLPFKLALVDERWALLPVSTGSALHSALVVRPCSLLDALSGLFALSWSQAMRIPRTGTSEESEAEGRRRELLTLLAAGLTDDSIARQLGVSTRTVQRLVREFMDSFGARTRFQAGVQAARLDLI
jgi:sugar-specific transcriptional regulator TrmB/DNA-binding CsgD family transcriptional regulator